MCLSVLQIHYSIIEPAFAYLIIPLAGYLQIQIITKAPKTASKYHTAVQTRR